MSELNIEFDQLQKLAVNGDPVDLLLTGATISQSEKRFIKQYHGNDYFTSLTTKFSRPVSTSDSIGLSSVTKQLLMLSTLLAVNIRKEQVRDGIAPEIGPDISREFSADGIRLLEGAIKPGKEVEALKLQITALRLTSDGAIQSLETQPESKVEATPEAKTTTRKKATPAPIVEEVG